MDPMDPETRRRVTSAGATARNAKADPDALLAQRRAGAAAVNSPAALARRLVRLVKEGHNGVPLSRAEKAEVRAILAAIAPRVARQPERP